MSVAVERTNEESSSPRPESAKNVERLLRELLDHHDVLDPHATNVDRVLDGEFVSFLCSERGEEFSNALRTLAYERLAEIDERTKQMRMELLMLERRLQRQSRVFAFVESAINRYRCRAAQGAAGSP